MSADCFSLDMVAKPHNIIVPVETLKIICPAGWSLEAEAKKLLYD
jgi:hypothetical protein